MAVTRADVWECDRCHTKVTLEEYEGMPKDWKRIDGREACPSCASGYESVMHAFWAGGAVIADPPRRSS
jgi:RNA polymerase subunit RPABC4/transcription elongation factor Spt4